jgi:glycine dehydrogenase subunit 1
VVRCGRPPGAVLAELAARNILGGIPLGQDYPELADAFLVCITEQHRRADIDALAAALAGGAS